MANLLQLSEATLLAVHSLVLISKSEDKLISAKKMADVLKASENHLAKVLQRLVKNGFIKSNRGPKGGFILAKKNYQINLLEIYEAIEGRIDKKKCFMNCTKCPFKECIFGHINTSIFNEITNYLKNKTLKDF